MLKSKIRAKSSSVALTPTPALFDILQALDSLLDRSDLTLPSYVVLTSGSEGHPGDGIHAPTSRHYTGEALDIRTKNFVSLEAAKGFYKALQTALGPAFYVAFEFVGTPNAHIHVQPSRGTMYV